MTIDWGALAIVAAVSLAVGVLVVVLVSFALVGLSALELSPTGETTDEMPVIDRTRSRLSTAAGTAMAALCLVIASAIVLYGFFILVF